MLPIRRYLLGRARPHAPVPRIPGQGAFRVRLTGCALIKLVLAPGKAQRSWLGSQSNSAVRLPKKIWEVRDVRSDPRRSVLSASTIVEATFPFQSELIDLSLGKKGKTKMGNDPKTSQGQQGSGGQNQPGGGQGGSGQGGQAGGQANPGGGGGGQGGQTPGGGAGGESGGQSGRGGDGHPS
jgi:hypothetical protein